MRFVIDRKMIPQELNITIDKALEMNHELKTLYDTDEKIKELINMSRRWRACRAIRRCTRLAW